MKRVTRIRGIRLRLPEPTLRGRPYTVLVAAALTAACCSCSTVDFTQDWKAATAADTLPAYEHLIRKLGSDPKAPYVYLVDAHLGVIWLSASSNDDEIRAIYLEIRRFQNLVRTGNWDREEYRKQLRHILRVASAAGSKAVPPLVDTLQLFHNHYDFRETLIDALLTVRGGDAILNVLDFFDMILDSRGPWKWNISQSELSRHVYFIQDAPQSLTASDSTYLRMIEFRMPAVRRLGTRLLARRNSEAARLHFVAALERSDLRTVAYGAAWYIRQGDPLVEPVLERALQVTGDFDAANALLNSGNRRLSDSATQWALKNGYSILPFGNSGGPRWGSARTSR